jgi:MOSC domain-containing protein YiiM/ferredoxin
LQLLSVNTGRQRDIAYRGATFRTGIFKTAVAGRVMLHKEQVEGDEQADRRVHGGPDMAAYAYPYAHYAFWQEQLGRPSLPYGQFGENLTIDGLTEEGVHIGDVLRIGSALLQVSEPRIPCFKLVARMEAGADFSARFHKSRKLGFYLRVLETGEIGAGDAVERVSIAAHSPTVAEFIEVSQFDNRNLARLKRVQAAEGLSAKWIATLQKHIDRAEQNARPAITSTATGTEIVFARSGRTVHWDDEARHLLGLAERAGLQPGFGCRSGSCRTCLCTVLEGAIEYTEPVEPSGPGTVLLCSARPAGGRLVLDL